MSMNKRNIPISIPSMGDEEWMALKEPIESGWITQGPKVREFEKKFAERHQGKICTSRFKLYNSYYT